MGDNNIIDNIQLFRWKVESVGRDRDIRKYKNGGDGDRDGV